MTVRARSIACGLAAFAFIVELPVARGVRAVSEVSRESTDGSRLANQALLGCIWESSSFPLALDVGLRRVLSDGAPDWALTAGLTVDVAL